MTQNLKHNFPKKFKIKTKWDFDSIFNPKKFKKERKITINRLEKFFKKWKSIDLTNLDNLKNFLLDYEKLIYTSPGIFDNEYLYYFLKRLVSKNKQIDKKFERISSLRKNYLQQIENFLKPLNNLPMHQKVKLIRTRKLLPFKDFLNYYLFKKIEINLYFEKEYFLRKEIDKLLKEYKEGLNDKVLKKYLKLGEEVVNFNLKTIMNESKKLKTKSPVDIVFIMFGIEPKIIKDIKNFLLKNKKLFSKFDQENNQEIISKVYNKKISLDEVIQFLVETFNKIHPSFGKIILEYFQKGYVDVYIRKDKQITPRIIKGNIFQPNFVLLSFEERLKNLLHISHEFGHIVNYELIRKNEKPINCKQAPVINETIAYFFELFALENLKDKFIETENFSIIKNDFYFNWFFLIKNLIFEEELIKMYQSKKKISYKEITKIWKDSERKILGEKSEKLPNYSWLIYVRRGMFYAPLYLTSFLFADIILERFLNNKKFRNRFLKVLKIGKYLTLKDFCSFLKLRKYIFSN